MTDYKYIARDSGECAELERRIGILESTVSIESQNGTRIYVEDLTLPNESGTNTFLRPDIGKINDVSVLEEPRGNCKAVISMVGRDVVLLSIEEYKYTIRRDPLKSH